MTPTTDACVHHRWGSATEADVLAYLPAAWRDYVGAPDSLPGGGGARRVVPSHRYPNPFGDDLPGVGAVCVEDLVDGLFAPYGIERALLVHDQGMFGPAALNPYIATVFTRALNDWTIDAWLDREPRLNAVVLASLQDPQEGAAEIRRVGVNPQMAGVMMAAFPSGRLAGHPLYWPFYEAACELDLPIVLHRGADAMLTPTGPAGGAPLTFAEYQALSPMALMSHLLSLLANGVLLKYPSLRVYVVGAGISWIPGFLRRLEMSWLAFRREVPWMREPPSETFRRQVRVSTYGLERGARPQMLRGWIDLMPDLEDLLVYGSGFPSWDTASPAEVRDVLPEGWHAKVLSENAAGWLRWDGPPAP